MLSPSEFNNAVPKFTNGNYANNPVDPQYIEEPTLQDYNRGVEPLETLPAQWWNWLCNQFTSRFNKINTYVKNIFDEITQLLSLLNITPNGTESAITTGQLKNFFKELYPTYVSDKLELGTTYVPQTRTVNGHALTENVTVTKSDVGLGSVANTGDSANVSSNGTTKFTTGGAYNILTSIAPYFSTSTAYSVGALVTYLNKFYECTTAHSAGAWNTSHFTERSIAYIFTNYILPSFAPTFSTATAYGVGTFVIYQNRLYKCTTAHSAGAWNSSHFALATLNDLATAKADKVPGATNNDIAILDSNGNLKDSGISVADLTGVTDLAPLFSTTASYAVGEYVIYNENMYRCTVAHTGAWNANDFTQVTVGGELTNKADISDLAVPSDAVLHYSFDDLPDLPDGTAVYKKDNDFTDTTGWSGNANATISNGKITLSGSADTRKAYDIQMSAGLIICVKGVANKSANLYLTVRHSGSTSDTTLKNFNVESGKYFEVYGIVDAQSIYFNFYCSSEWDITISQIYIGDGSYNTPIIDNANGKWNATNNGGIATKGVSGKGARLLGNGYLTSVLPWKIKDKKVFTFSCWVRNYDLSTTLQLINNWESYTVHTLQLSMSPSSSNRVVISACTDDKVVRYRSLTFSPTSDMFVVCVFNKGDTKLYINGANIAIQAYEAYDIADINDSQNIYIGRLISSDYLYSKTDLDDLLIFDRALTEKEVVALYNNKANTPKYYNLNNYKIDNANVAEEGGTGKYIESIKQEGGLIVPVEQTIDTAPVSASAKPITSGSMYNFLGGNTSAQSWLGKVFGWALGRNWSEGTGITTPGVISKNIRSIYYGNDIWVAAGNNLYYSYDGITWTVADVSTGNGHFSSVYYADGVWVACAQSNSNNIGIYWSSDGVNWTASSSSNGKLCNSVYYSNGLWVACKEGSVGVIWSSDGKIWTDGTGSSVQGKCIFGTDSGRWVMAGNGISWSSDGKTWHDITLSDTPNLVSIYYDKKSQLYFIAGSAVYYSTTITSWTKESNLPANTYFNHVHISNGIVALFSDNGIYYLPTNFSYSHTWKQATINGLDTNFITAYYANGIWVSSSTAGYLYWSLDATTWFTNARIGYKFDSIFYANGIWVAAGVRSYYSNYSNSDLQ